MKTPHVTQGLMGTLLILTGCSVALGPVFLLLINPQALMASDRLSVSSFLTPYFIIAFFCMVLYTGKLKKYVFESWRQVFTLLSLWLILLLSAAIFDRFDSLDFNTSFLGAIAFYITVRGCLKESPALLSKVLYSYVFVSGVVALFYIALIGTSLAPMGGGRYFFLGENPNSYSTRMAISIAIAIFLQRDSSGTTRYLLIIAAALQIFVIYLSGSRGAILMIAVSFVLLLLSSADSLAKRALYVAGGLVAVSLVVMLLNDNNVSGSLHVHTIERMLDFLQKGETAGRTQLWEQALEIFTDNPIIGVGGSNFTDEMAHRYNDARDAHNLFIFLLASSGIVGFSLFLSFALPLLWRSCKVWRSKPIALAILLPMFLAMFKMGGILTYSLMWFTFALSEALVLTGSRSWMIERIKR